tara:strand:+ start:203 stop:433 length:231 start_codon:yes stop_codon:yes gene_type:complete
MVSALLITNGLRIVDKVLTSGLIFNRKDKNGAKEGAIDKPKALRDFIVWIPLVIIVLQICGVISLDQAEALTEVLK